MNQKLMKKSLITLAVLGAFAGAAQAQAPADVVTLYGSFDGGIRGVTPVSVDANGNKLDRFTVGSNGTYNSNRLGFKGNEDLGGGNNAHFDLEIGFNTGTGTTDNANNTLFNRSAYVGLGGKWGALDIGRQYSVAFKVIGGYDPFNYKYTGIIPLAGAAIGSQAIGTPAAPLTAVNGAGATRFNNDIQYTGTFGPVTARAEYALGEQAGSNNFGSNRGAAEALGVTFGNGPFSVGGAYSEQKPNVGAAFQQYRKQSTIGGAFTAGPVRVAGGYIDDRLTGTAGELKIKNGWVGVSFAASPAVEATVALYETKVSGASPLADGKRDLIIAGVTYGFSKRTNFYADIDYAKGKDSLNPVLVIGKDKQTGISVGINHLF
jgi:Outer membrane protein (porin)